jgi:hypothetical protein
MSWNTVTGNIIDNILIEKYASLVPIINRSEKASEANSPDNKKVFNSVAGSACANYLNRQLISILQIWYFRNNKLNQITVSK